MSLEMVVSSRSVEDRVAIPLQQPEPRPSLIPDDVWHSYQQEVEQSMRADAAELPVEPSEDGMEVITAETEIGMSSSSPADAEVALFALQRVAMFDDLDNETLEILIKGARQGEVSSGEYLFVEGDVADSFFVIIDGALEVLRRREEREVALRHMGTGEAIGLFGLFSGRVRAACARAIGDLVVLEVPVAAFAELLKKNPPLHERLHRFYQERLLEGFLGSSKLFSDVDSIARARLIGRFAEKHLAPNETLVRPGEVSNLIAVIISGRVVLEQPPRAGQDPKTFELFPGQFVAVTSAFTGAPSRMRVYAGEDTDIALIGHKELSELLRDYPGLRAMTGRLPTVARTLDRDIYCGHTGVPGL
ncbi:MAG: Crp/Fnr family transcriptional regulator [Myxococcaceae bacterium]